MTRTTGRLIRCFSLALAGLLAALSAQAGAWHSLKPGSTTNAPATLSLLSESDAGLVLQARFPGFRLGDRRHPLAGDYVAPEMPGCGISSGVGAPELPVLRRLVAVPAAADLTLAWQGVPKLYTLQKGPFQAFFPRQRPRLKGPASPKLEPFDFDVAAYAGDRFSPDPPCRLTEAGLVEGRRMVLVEVFPVSVNPITGGLRLFADLTLTLDFGVAARGVKSAAAGSPAVSPALAGLAINAESAAAAVKAPSRLLIVAPDAWLGALAPLVAHRQAGGWAVDTLGVQAAGGTAAAIRATLRTRYQSSGTRPAALLLVGDVAQLPCFIGTQEDNPDTDLYYACMDGAGDWQPEFPVGRISVSSMASLGDVLAKIIAVETVPSAPWMMHATFMASEDNHAITESSHNAVIATQFEPNGYTCDKLYTLSKHATPAQVRKAFNEGRIMGVYSGHGDTGYWADGPVLYKSDVQGLTNDNRYPMIFSFACLTGRYSLNECFAETWLRQPGRGACGVLASSVTSYWDEDDIFERRLFDTIFSEGLHQYGAALLRAKFRLIETYGLTATVRRYFEQYNLFGDPAAPLREAGLSFLTASPLTTGRVGRPYDEALQASGGRQPYRWTAVTDLPPGLSLDPDTGSLFGTPLEALENGSVLIRLSDADLNVVTGRFRLDITVDPLRITGGTNAGPFQAGAPFSSALSARGGVPPYTWDFLKHASYESRPGQGAWIAAGKAMNWTGDEKSWKIQLPWAFRFFETSYTSLWVNSNGYLDFGSKISQWDNGRDELLKHPRIAPLWDDIRTTNVYVSLSSTRVAIRWTGSTFNAGYPVDFQAILRRNGSIVFLYKTMRGKLSPTVGIAAGDGASAVMGHYNGYQALTAGNCETLAWRPPLAVGVTLSPEGVLSGAVSAPQQQTATVVVTDQSVPAQTDTAVVTLTIE